MVSTGELRLRMCACCGGKFLFGHGTARASYCPLSCLKKAEVLRRLLF